MDPDFAQRRRLAVAAAITVVLVPAAFLMNRDSEPDPIAGPLVTVVGTTPTNSAAVDIPAGASADAGSSDSPSATDVMGTAPVAYLDGTVPPDDKDPATIAIPRVYKSISGEASFRRDDRDLSMCEVRGVPFDSLVTITNLDNSHSVKCRAGIRYSEKGEEVVLHADAFIQIADLTEAPVPVEITW